MVATYSKDLREKIVQAYKNGIGTIMEIAELFGVNKRTVDKYLAIDRETGDLTPGKPTGRPPILDEANLKIIKKIILANPSGTLNDYCVNFKCKTGITISKSCVWDACTILNLNRKKKVFTHKNKIEKI